MQFRKGNEQQGNFVKFLILVIPIVNLYGMWKLSKIWANVQFEKGD